MKNITLTGKMAGDPELRYAASGKAVCNFAVMVRDSYKKDNDFFECVAFGKKAEFVAQYFPKGKPMSVIGAPGFNKWNDKETGKPRKRFEISVSDANFVPDDKTTGETTTTTTDDDDPGF